MKQWTLTLLLLSASQIFALLPDRQVFISGEKTKVENLEIVVESSNPLLDFAAGELQTMLKTATGSEVPIVNTPAAGATSLILGNNSFALANGLAVETLPDEGYFIEKKGSRIYLLGRDSERDSPLHNRWGQYYQRGTLSAVYDFLERFAGAHFFFPGKYGTIIPKKDGLYLPERIRILERPELSDRRYYSGTARWYDEGIYNGVKGENLHLLRLRFSENMIPFGHGLAYLNFIERFSQTHPEFFALTTDGKRYCEGSMLHTGQLCFNSGIREEIYQDAKAYLSGAKPALRGLKYWNLNSGSGRYFSLMTQDWMYWCACEKCQAIAEPGRGKIYSSDRQAVSDFIWAFTSEVAQRLTKEGIPGTITQMAYSPYDLIPNGNIASNIVVQVAVNGRGSDSENEKKDTEKIRAWTEKLGNKVSVWTYAMGKHMNKNIPGIPAMMPRHVDRFIKKNQAYIIGGFFESETDFFLFNYLNYYVLGKVLWDPSIDVQQLLDEHYQVMFGEGAAMMEQFFSEMEDAWMNKILGAEVMTGLGPKAKIPSEIELWTRIYSPAKLAEYASLFIAAKAAATDPEAVERIEFIQDQLFAPIQDQAAKFQRNQKSLDSWRVSVPGTVHLRPLKGEINEVSTVVKISRSDTTIDFRFECEEPRLPDIKILQSQNDAPETYADSCVELLLNPSGDRQNYFHLIVNAAGVLADYSRRINESCDITWNSEAKVQTARTSNSWTATISLPIEKLGLLHEKEVPVNFARHRALNGAAFAEIYYQWSPLPGSGFHNLETWGVLDFAGKAGNPILFDGTFEVSMTSRFRAGEWVLWQSGKPENGQLFELDSKVFIIGGQSLHMVNKADTLMNAVQKLPLLKPGRRYRFSYFIRTRNLLGAQGAGAYIYFNKSEGRPYPAVQISGTTPWHKQVFEFTTPVTTGEDTVPVLGLWIWKAAGEAWFDDVAIDEID